jgi:uncharacterized protein YajQ (UPF0234 family)
MAQDFSFDIVCGFDKQEMTNALDQTRREITNRYDFKGVLADIEVNEGAKELVIHTESEAKVAAVLDILESKMIKRNIPLTVFDKSKELEEATGGTVRKRIKLRDSLSIDQAKEIAKLIRDEGPKGAKPVIQGDSVRVSSKSKDDLQQIITLIKQKEMELPIQFNNYR